MSNNKAFKVKNGLDLGEYSKAISDTAVDVFVYDTSKDSDGGAWRKRTQHTSWYNETLNTATRGSRKEFPAVAVIVAESSQVTIYDGDDPDLPMWMVFNAGTHKLIGMATGGTPGSITCMTAYQGVIAIGIGAGNGRGLTTANLIAERAYYYSTGTSSRGFNGNIAERNDAKDDYNLPDIGPIVALEINDVAMTVLPNAPIDAATGLPVPTIAVATDGGVSVIKDDGTVVSDSTIDGITPYVGSVAFWNNETLAVQYGYASTDDFTRIRTFSYPAMTEQYQYRASQDYSGFMGAASNWTESLTNKAAIGSEYGLIALHRADDPSEVTAANQMVAQVASSYNTGWQNGDIKLTTLSDTDDTDVTGSELVTNGTAPISSTTSWNGLFSNTTVSLVSNAIRADADATGAYGVSQAITLDTSKRYTVTATVNFGNASGSQGVLRLATAADLQSGYLQIGTTTGTYSITFTPTASTMYVGVADTASSASNYSEISNISVRLAEADRSVNGNGLQVFGSITKNPVNSGADLVAYSGWSSNNYLSQPYNSDLDLGTTDFCVMTWVKRGAPPSYAGIISYGNGDNTTNKGWIVRVSTSYRVEFRSDVTGGGSLIAPSGNALEGTWTHVCFVRSGSTLSLYQNGKFVNSTTGFTADLEAGTSATLDIGTNEANDSLNVTTNSFVGSLALARVSATAPSPEQIAKIYEDEKVLFQDGAQATLYGSSDAVTALAYDDSTELLHVGTSGGRSVFQGLRRVDNTTTAVGAAISASNGLVADE